MAEGARLESVYTGNRIVGSNPTPSARPLPQPVLWQGQTSFKSVEFGFLGAEPLYSDKPSAGNKGLSRVVFL